MIRGRTCTQADHVTFGKMWQYQIRHGSVAVTQPMHATDICMVQALGGKDVLLETLNSYLR